MSKIKQKIINEAPKVKPLGDLKIAESRGRFIKIVEKILKGEYFQIDKRLN
jgi:hypothetical protein